MNVAPSIDLSWVGSEDAVQFVQQIVSSYDVPTKIGTKQLGLHSKVWVTPKTVIDADGIIDEPLGGANTNFKESAKSLKNAFLIKTFLCHHLSGDHYHSNHLSLKFCSNNKIIDPAKNYLFPILFYKYYYETLLQGFSIFFNILF